MIESRFLVTLTYLKIFTQRIPSSLESLMNISNDSCSAPDSLNLGCPNRSPLIFACHIYWIQFLGEFFNLRKKCFFPDTFVPWKTRTNRYAYLRSSILYLPCSIHRFR